MSLNGTPPLRQLVSGQNWDFYWGETAALLADLNPSVKADVAICDPPYFIGFAKYDFDNFSRNTEIKDSKGGEAFNDKWLKNIGKVLKEHGTLIIHAIMRNVGDVIAPAQRHGWKINDFIVWEKPNNKPTRNPLILKRTTEAVIVFNREETKINQRYFLQSKDENDKRLTDVWRLKVSASDCADPIDGLRHPCQKPSELIRQLLDVYCPPGGVVFDPFAGSGIVGEVAIRSGRKYVGADNDVHWATRITARLKKAEGESLCVENPTSGE